MSCSSVTVECVGTVTKYSSATTTGTAPQGGKSHQRRNDGVMPRRSETSVNSLVSEIIDDEQELSPEIAPVLSRVGCLKKRLTLLNEKQVDFSGLPAEVVEGPFGLRVVLKQAGVGSHRNNSQQPVGITRVTSTSVTVSVTAAQFSTLYYFLNFYRENPATLDEVTEGAARILRDAGIEEEPINLEVSLYRKVPGIVRRVGQGICIFEAESPIELHDLGRLFFHEESAPFVLLGSLASFFTEDGFLALENILALKLHLANSFPARQHSRFMLFGSVVLFALGMRLPQKIDLLIDEKGATRSFVQGVERSLNRSVLARVEPYLRGSGEWAGEKAAAYDEWFNCEWPRLLGVESLHELFADSSRHGYFLGLRITSLRDDIRRRTSRVRPAACADLVALKRIPDLSRYCTFEIPEFPDTYWANFREYSMTAVDRPKFVKTINAFLKERYTFTLPEPTLWSLFSE